MRFFSRLIISQVKFVGGLSDGDFAMPIPDSKKELSIWG